MTVVRRGSLLSCAFAMLFAGLVSAQEPAKEAATLTFKAAQKWSYILPSETWTVVSGSIPIAHANGNGFAAEAQGTALAIDTNGDNKVDEKIKGIKGAVVLKGKDANGGTVTYAVRLQKQGDQWKFSSNGVLVGKVRGVDVTLIDQDNNGSFGNVGVDGMIVGDGEAASYLSKVINLGGELFHFEVADGGKTVSTTPYTGECGTLNVRKGFEGTGTIHTAIVANASGEWSFNPATAKGGMKVPVGDYILKSGYITKGTESVKLKQGRMSTVNVRHNETTELAWGGPLTVEFDHVREGEKLTIQYTSVKYFGKSGEEYVEFIPDATSPIIKVTDRKTGLLLTQGRFSGC